MDIIIKGFNKPKNCHGCPFNRSDCWCSRTKGEIDRDDYLCNKPCPITEIITCKDCDHYHSDADGARYCEIDNIYRKHDFYCKYAEKRVITTDKEK